MGGRLTEISELNNEGKLFLLRRIRNNGYNIKPEEDENGTSLICTKKGEETHRVYIRNNNNKKF